jgi:hypothetical protein
LSLDNQNRFRNPYEKQGTIIYNDTNSLWLDGPYRKHLREKHLGARHMPPHKSRETDVASNGDEQ